MPFMAHRLNNRKIVFIYVFAIIVIISWACALALDGPSAKWSSPNKLRASDSKGSSLDKLRTSDSKWSNLDNLRTSPWYMYLTKIYSDMQLQWMLDMGPIDMQDFWIIQPKLLPPSLRAVLPEPLPERPSFYRSLFTVLDPHVSGETSAVYQYQYHGVAAGGLDLNFKLLRGVPDDTWVEVQRGADSVGAYVWFYYMKGSGNWLNVGKTLSFIDHANAFEWFRIATPPDDGDQKQTNLAKAALADGYDSIQFTMRSEEIFKYEIFFLRFQQVGNNPCVPGIRTRSFVPCSCNPLLTYLNCYSGSAVLPLV